MTSLIDCFDIMAANASASQQLQHGKVAYCFLNAQVLEKKLPAYHLYYFRLLL